MPELFFGKYRAQVIDNGDPELRGRLLVVAPAIAAEPLYWADACISASEAAQADQFVPPPIGAMVWVEFEGGSPDQPIWSGCRWPTEGW